MNKAAIIIAPAMLLFMAVGCRQGSNQQNLSRAEKIHRQVLTVDTHTDTPLNLGDPEFDIGMAHDADSSFTCIDLPRMKGGHMDATFFAAYLGQGPRTKKAHQKAKSKAMDLLKDIHQSIGAYPQKAQIATRPDQAYQLEEKGKRAIYIGVENGYALGGKLSTVETFYKQGARYITLCHTSNNDLCDSSTDPDGPEHSGLSQFGKQVVRKMNELGMIVDVSHISDQSFYDVLEVSQDPIMASHSCARALREHPRNLSDPMLQALAENEGIIQICLVSDYLKKPEPQPKRDSAFAALRQKYDGFQNLTDEERNKLHEEWRHLQKQYPKKLAHVNDVVDHIDHVVQTIGIDHVGIGTDFDGGARVEGCRDVSQVPNITRELIDRGYTREEIEKIWGGNFMRVFREVSQPAKKSS